MRSPVFLTGATSLLLYTFLTQLSNQFNWGEGYSERPLLSYLAVYFSLCALYGLTWFFVRKRPNDRRNFWTIIVFGLLFRAVIMPSQQIQEDDVYRYLWDGKVFANGINPFKYAPSEVNDFKALRIQNPESYYETYVERNERELEQLDKLKWASPKSLTSSVDIRTEPIFFASSAAQGARCEAPPIPSSWNSSSTSDP